MSVKPRAQSGQGRNLRMCVLTFPPKTRPLAKKRDRAVMGPKGEPMTRKRHTAEQISAVLKEAQAGIRVQDLCRKHGILDARLLYVDEQTHSAIRDLAPMEFINHLSTSPGRCRS